MLYVYISQVTVSKNSFAFISMAGYLSISIQIPLFTYTGNNVDNTTTVSSLGTVPTLLKSKKRVH